MQSQLKVSFVVYSKSGDAKASLGSSQEDLVEESWVTPKTYSSLKAVPEVKTRYYDL